ncbi:DEAD/DEAH box helicase [Zooshikella ganghwensis]|uniref:Helicase SNF2 n=1 Tax=Zooshikella ganghwensis TaxID=202772 RepID=A0A4P9VPR9_9GAMM|nr:DEAD/DEAH box helicase [Zooshikella ganghwensis]RDH45495.1 helicase SNF2 [Zooshikella ganghwensis]
MNFLKYQDIEDNISSTFVRRGKDYFRHGHVDKVYWDSDDDVIRSVVSGRNRYTQEIHVSQYYGEVDIDGYCSCPVDYNCKHVAAALLKYLEQRGSVSEKNSPKSQLSFSSWQHQFESVIAQEKHTASPRYEATPGKEFLVYILQLNNGDLSIDCYSTKKYKKGGFSALHDVYRGWYGNHVWSNADGIIKNLIGNANNLSETHNPYQLLTHLANSGRAYVGEFEPNNVLTEGRLLDIQFNWQAQDNLKQLKLSLADAGDDDWVVLPTQPVCYFNKITKQFGRINTQLNYDVLLMLQRLPALDVDQQFEVAGLIRSGLGSYDIPLPVEWKVTEVNEQPIPKLLISKSAGGQKYLGELIFVYGEHQFPYSKKQTNPQTVFKNNVEYLVRLQPEQEQLAFKQLVESNYLPEDNDYVGFPRQDEKVLFNIAHNPSDYYQFKTEVLPVLQEQGWKFDETAISEQFKTAKSWDITTHDEGSNWFSFALDIDIDGTKVAALPLIIQWLTSASGGKIARAEKPVCLACDGIGWIVVPAETINSILDILVELYDRPTLSEDGKLKVNNANAVRLEALAEALQKVRWLGDKSIKKLGKELANFKGIKKLKPPRGLKATLRDYQQEGVEWLQFLRRYRLGGVLADDMGLGKTIQILSHIQLEKERGRLKQPAMVVVPTSVLGNWQKEAAKFTPSLNTCVWYGTDRNEYFEQLPDYQLIITSYGTFQRDAERLAEYEYHMLILDEAQYIKNSKSKISVSVRLIKANHHLCMTGTPLENHLGELWSLYDFVMPGFLGNERSFNRLFRKPIEIEGHQQRHQALSQQVGPFLLRRTKDAVADELPEKTEMIRSVELGASQQKLYESIRLSMEKKVRSLLKTKGLNRSRIEILDALMKLRQACCDPRLVKLDKAKKVKQSAKLTLLKELLVELLDENRKILLFSQFTSMLTLIEKEVNELRIPYAKLTGQTRKREEVISKFQNGDVPLFLISLKAGGVGLNLTQADTVIHYDPWWNPAVEQQATDRAYRIGQDKPVFVYRLICTGTVEEKILAMQERKQSLADGIYNNKAGEQLALTSEEILDFFTPGETKNDIF